MFKFKLPAFFSFWNKSKKTLQKRVIDTPQDIARMLQRMQEHIVIVTARFDSDPDTYNTSIINVDASKEQFYLDEFLPSVGNEQLKKLKKVSLRSRLDGAILTMDGLLKSAEQENGIPYFIMHFPEQIRSIQRRESYRVSIPVGKRIQATMQTDAGHFIAGFLHDISFSGVSIRLEETADFGFKEQDLKVGMNIPFLTLHLDEVITCSMEIKRISHAVGHIIVSGRLEDISPVHQRNIQQFIRRLDREKRQQEKEIV